MTSPIVVCEPQCTGASHEKVNSGFLALLRHAYPADPIWLFADPSHHEGLRAILAHDRVSVDPIEHHPFAIHDPYGIRGGLACQRELERVLRGAAAAGSRDVLFLSWSPIMLAILKRLRTQPDLQEFRCSFVLHADFEDIANERFAEVPTTAVAAPSLVDKLRSVRPLEVPGKVLGLVRREATARYSQAWRARFRIRDVMERDRGPDDRFIALSPHVRANAANYVDVEALGIHVVEMPYNFAPPGPAPVNDHLKLATFGYGDPGGLRVILERLATLAVRAPYEVRVIGMDNRGLAGFANVTCPSPGKILPRTEMERHAADIDAFLILYGTHRYHLSCSGSIFEALSYLKPVLHVGNECVTQFDRPGAPIGFRAPDLGALATLIAEMIADYPSYRTALAERRANILALRDELAMARLAPKLRAAFPRR